MNFAANMLGDTNSPGMQKVIERISNGKTSTTPGDLIDACLYELGCVEIGSNTKAILIEELNLSPVIQIDDDFGDKITQVIELIVASREYQLS